MDKAMGSTAGSECCAGNAGRSPWRAVATLVLLLAGLLASGAGLAQEWRYEVRPGDNIWNLAVRYMRHDVPWQKLQQHNSISDPYRLPPGSTLHFPVQWLKLQPAKAQVIGVHGAATVRDANGTLSDIVEGMRLGVGANLRTAADASLTLQFADGSRLLLHGDSELVLDKLSAFGATGMADTRMRLPRGRAGNTVHPMRGPAAHFIIETPTTMASVRGTQFRIGSEPGRSLAEVTRGKVAVSGSGGQVVLRPGQGTVIADGSRPGAPVALLPAPDPASIRADAAALPVRLRWDAVPGAEKYRVQVAADGEFRALLLDAVVAQAQAAADLPDGDYHLHVRAIDGNGLEGADATASARIAPQPPFVIAPTQGSSLDSGRPRFKWTDMGDGVRYRFQLTGAGGFDAPLLDERIVAATTTRSAVDLVPDEYQWRVAAQLEGGRSTAFSDATHFSVRPPGPGPEAEASTSASDPRATQLRWPAGAQGERFRFQLSRKPDFSTLEIDRELTDNQITLPHLRSGTWYARVQVVQDDGYAGPFGPAQRLKLGCLPCRLLAGGGIVVLLLSL